MAITIAHEAPSTTPSLLTQMPAPPQQMAITSAHETPSITPSFLTQIPTPPQQMAITSAHEAPSITPSSLTLMPTPPAILAAAQPSLDAFQRSAAWQKVGVDPALLSRPTFAPQTPPPTPTHPSPLIIKNGASLLPHISMSPPLSMDNLQTRDEDAMEIDQQHPEDIAMALEDEASQPHNVCPPEPNDDFNQPNVDVPLSEHTHPVLVDLQNSLLSAAATSLPVSPIKSKISDEADNIQVLSSEDEHEDYSNSDLQTKDESMEVDDDGKLRSPGDIVEDVTSPSETTHPAPMELDNNLISTASTSPPVSPIQCIASNKADDVQGLSCDNEDSQGDTAEALMTALNDAINLNASNGSDTDGEDDDAVVCQPVLHVPRRKNNQNLTQVPPKPFEVIDLTLEKVSCRILFGPVF
jgi:hypothetical protein